MRLTLLIGLLTASDEYYTKSARQAVRTMYCVVPLWKMVRFNYNALSVIKGERRIEAQKPVESQARGFPFHSELGLNWGVNYCKEEDFGQLVFMLFLAASIYYL
ncbi:hypothetical protein Acr_00g0044760 [Actinidia rufa]|uniref:Uncharacterized protein n=1 Tax=Actinidia rufa TaxID=165716 RepID=A0A7J0DJ28_9ERIC|nr:hypothetical protein Acr_00g0044760 [Actinidia rufa]